MVYILYQDTCFYSVVNGVKVHIWLLAPSNIQQPQFFDNETIYYLILFCQIYLAKICSVVAMDAGCESTIKS